ncbi:extracellular catalytic domain type 1 short-chain-length polyhydroxyalkanoate depolymerase [Sphingomonas sp.]|uniref:extracellular catalytic domain type 1 short-chain-length polyhydroxyalkanoate depolymerase n=1 Tax=Sphingomonas sp. TaxID=28214 RepID=UPI002FDA9303
MRLHPNIMEATRLTREGKLGDATALLRSMLGGTVAEPAPRPTVLRTKPPQLPGRGADGHQPSSEASPSGKAGGTFEAHIHTGPQGRLTYKLYVPGSATSGAPLILMLHGCTQDPDDFAAGTGMNDLADEFGFLVAYPAQTKAANASRCWNWFRPGDQKRDGGEPALIAGATREIMARYGIDPKRVYVAGMSAGGAAATIMGEAYPDLFSAVGVHSGLACGAASDLPSAMMAMRGSGVRAAKHRGAPTFVPTITFHGDRDQTVDRVNSDHIVERVMASGGPILTEETIRGDDGRGRRAYTRRILRDAGGTPRLEQWTIRGAGHAWAGGDPAGSYTDRAGPDASREMVRFFLAQG